MKICISQATILPSSFEEDLQAFIDGGCSSMEVWLTKLEKHLEAHDASELRQQARDADLTFAAAAYQGGLLLSQGEQRRLHFDHFRKRLDLCEYFSIPTMLLHADFLERPGEQDLERAIVSLKQAAQWADGAGVRLALEPRGDNRFCNCIPTAVALLYQADEPNLGLCLDAHHYYTGPSKAEDLGLLSPDNLFHVQLSDMLGVPRELASDADRILPGDGELQLQTIMMYLKHIDYQGYLSLELMNQTLWEVKASQVVELGVHSIQRLLDEEA